MHVLSVRLQQLRSYFAAVSHTSSAMYAHLAHPVGEAGEAIRLAA